MSNVLTISENNQTLTTSETLVNVMMVSASTVSGSSETPSSIKTKYESNADTNAFTDAEKTKVSNLSGTNTGDQDISGITTNASAITALDSSKADKSNVLELDNTDSFTPSADYHPATKKYVDDNAGGGSEFLDTEFRIVDNTSGLKQIFDTSLLTADTTITFSPRPLNLRAVIIDDDGTVSVGGDLNGYKNWGSYNTYLGVNTGNDSRGSYNVIVGHGVNSGVPNNGSYNVIIGGFHGGLPWGTNNTVILQDGQNNVAFKANTATSSVYQPFQFAAVTTAERTALPNTSNTTVYDTDLNKVFTNDGTSWNAHW